MPVLHWANVYGTPVAACGVENEIMTAIRSNATCPRCVQIAEKG